MIDAPSETPADETDPGLVLREGVPVSTRFDNVYFSRGGGLAETAHVFLDGCGLPQAWHDKMRETAKAFTVAETGFGTGLNFLATWDLWRRHRPAGGVLHYLAIEGFPIPGIRLAETLAAFPRLSGLAARLIDTYPPVMAPGPHRIWFEEDRVCLTLVIGEAAQALAGTQARVDAWFLDGFAPAKNPSIWRPEVLREIARLSGPGARLASFTAAGAVRRGLAAVGFAVEKRQGFGSKHHCIAARFTAPTHVSAEEPWYTPPPAIAPGRVAVIGAGIAGAAVVGALARRGIDARWFDRHGRMAAEASGNPSGLIMARPTADADVHGEVTAASFRYARACADRAGVALGGDGVLELAADDAALGRFSTMAAVGVLAPVSASLVDSAEASRVAGIPLARPAIRHHTGGWVDPRAWSAAFAGTAAPSRAAIARIERCGQGWALSDATGAVLATADAVIVASAMATAPLLPAARLPLQAIRGQLTRIGETPASRRLRSCLAFGGYLAPALSGYHVAGATYTRGGFDPLGWPVPVLEEDHRRTLGTLPAEISRLFADAPTVLGGRAAIRAVTPDRQLIAGPVSDADALVEAYGHLRRDAKRLDGGSPPFIDGVFALTGLGSRGLVTAPLMAELVIAQMLGEPWPVSRAIAAAVHPNRFVIRDLRRHRL